MKKLLFTLLLFLSLNQASNAGLLGSEVVFKTQYQAHIGDKILIIMLPVAETIVEPGIEFPSDYHTDKLNGNKLEKHDFDYGVIDIDSVYPLALVGVNVGDDFIEIDFTDSGRFSQASENTYVFKFSAANLTDNITSVTIDSSVTTLELADPDVQFIGNKLFINLRGLPFNSSSFVRINIDSTLQKYAIGDTGPAGGWVFYVTDDGLHGLEAAPKNLQLATWGCYSTDVGADGVLIYTGKANTKSIISAKCKGAPLYGGNSLVAAKLANYYQHGGYTDWFLPSQDELKLIYSNLFLYDLGDFPIHKEFVSYWSSTELDTRKAYVTHFFGSSDKNYKPRTGTMFKHLARHVRPIRSF